MDFDIIEREGHVMDISLPEDLAAYVSQKVESGLYPSASDVVLDCVRLMKKREDLRQAKLDDLLREIDLGIEQADRGEVVPLNDETIADIKARGRERLAAQQQAPA